MKKDKKNLIWIFYIPWKNGEKMLIRNLECLKYYLHQKIFI